MITFFLGAKDPEMNLIEDILNKVGIPTVYAEVQGVRVSASNAYEAENYGEGALVECGGLFLTGKKFDHHRNGDFGYGKPAQEFLAASSLGQVLDYLLTHERERTRDTLQLTTKKAQGIHGFHFTNEWEHASMQESIVIPKEYVLQAAADHCLRDAYRGKCPGVHTGRLRGLSVRNIAQELGISYSQVNAQVNKHLEHLESAKSINIAGSEVKDLRTLDLGIGYSIRYLALREAAMVHDKPYLCTHQTRIEETPRIFLNATSPAHAQRFLEENPLELEAESLFGNPARGYAGGRNPIE